MIKRTVYRFHYLDRVTREVRLSDDYATAAAIAEIGAVALKGMSLEVDASRVAFSGFLKRTADGED